MIGPGSGITLLDGMASLGGVNGVRRAAGPASTQPVERTPRLAVNHVKDRVDLSPEARRHGEAPDDDVADACLIETMKDGLEQHRRAC